MARKRPKNTAYNGGHIRETARGTFQADLYVDGKQQRQTFKLIEEAQGFIDRVRVAQERRSLPLTMTELVEAREALDLLPEGVGLREVARWWLEANRSPVKATSAKDALARLIEEKNALDRRRRTGEGYRDHVGKFLRDTDTEATPVHEFTTDHIKAWLARYRGSSWNGYRRTLHAFFAWCKREGMCASNPVKPIPVATVRKDRPVCLPVAQVKIFLDAVAINDPELMPYFAIGFFTGARSAELDRMEAVCIEEEFIHIGAGQAKINAQRFLTIQDNLRAWLAQFPAPERLRVRNHRKRYRDVLKAIRAVEETKDFAWPRNAMRHSFASYHLAAFKNSASTAHELGHTSPALLFSTYRTLATEADGLAYFAIIPPQSNTE